MKSLSIRFWLHVRRSEAREHSLDAIGLVRVRGYGGFVFKQWKERYLVLTAEGSVLVCRDADSSPDQVVALQGACEAIVEGKEILDLPRLPPGGRRDCCFALILPQDKFLLLLADNPNDCSHWLNLLRKVRESVASPQRNCRRHRAPTPCITDRDPGPFPEYSVDKEPGSPRFGDREPSTPGGAGGKDRGGRSPRSPKNAKAASPQRYADCLRHGTRSDVRAVRAVYLLMGGAAASSALGYLGSCSAAPRDAPAPNPPPSADFSDLGSEGTFHACGQSVDSAHFQSFDFEGDSDFDAFDCGGFAF
ncbi:uncharacterized protein LOC114910169 [Scleropages formosus]|uniref:uncharacterized protein LOC114910169 n=1 Tax=Scleropages formosus TaxID=113540 RepID=UPI0010FAC817|nr:uncharacterized protein LOC114910169 [Scleropages formosus]